MKNPPLHESSGGSVCHCSVTGIHLGSDFCGEVFLLLLNAFALLKADSVN